MCVRDGVPQLRGSCVLAAPFQVVDFYEYYEGLQEGWDGPALLVFSDGKKVRAIAQAARGGE